MENFNEDIVLNIEISYEQAVEDIVKLQTANTNLQKDLTELKKQLIINCICNFCKNNFAFLSFFAIFLYLCTLAIRAMDMYCCCHITKIQFYSLVTRYL